MWYIWMLNQVRKVYQLRENMLNLLPIEAHHMHGGIMSPECLEWNSLNKTENDNILKIAGIYHCETKDTKYHEVEKVFLLKTLSQIMRW